MNFIWVFLGIHIQKWFYRIINKSFHKPEDYFFRIVIMPSIFLELYLKISSLSHTSLLGLIFIYFRYYYHLYDLPWINPTLKISLSLFMTSLTQLIKFLKILWKISGVFRKWLLMLSRFLWHWQLTLLNSIIPSFLLLEKSSNV